MEIAPLALVMLLGYGLLIAVALTTWTAVAYFREEPVAENRAAETTRAPRPVQERRRQKPQVSNDDVRGARSRRERRGNDPFQDETTAAAAGDKGNEKKESAGTGEARSWAPDTSAPKRQGSSNRSESKDASGEEDAFERFLSSRPDDFDIR